jgi:hypothetical protein
MKSKKPFGHRIGSLIFFLFSIVGISVFFYGVNPDIFGYSSEDLSITRLISWTLSPILIGLGFVWFDLMKTDFLGKAKLTWWRIIIYIFTLGGMSGLLISSLPFFSVKLYIIFLGWTGILILITFLWMWKSWFFIAVIMISYFPVYFFLLATRLWKNLIGFHFGWFLAFLGSHLFSWFLPVLLPKISKILFREQFYPITRWGKFLFRLAGSLLPIAAFGGVLLGTTLRDFSDDVNILVLAIMSTILAIMAPQPLAHQLFNENPFGDLFENR